MKVSMNLVMVTITAETTMNIPCPFTWLETQLLTIVATTALKEHSVSSIARCRLVLLDAKFRRLAKKHSRHKAVTVTSSDIRNCVSYV